MSQVNDLSFYLKKFKRRERKSKLKNEIENSRAVEEIKVTKDWLSKKIHETDKPQAKLTKKIERRQIVNIRNGKGDIAIDRWDIKQIVREYYK